MMKKALITGVTGQDGAYLAQFLLEKGYKVFGTYRRSSTPNFWRLQTMGVLKRITMIPADLSDMASLLEAITVSDPDEIYNLAAQSYVGASFDQPLHTTEIDAMGSVRILEIIRHLKNNIKFYQASTSELYGSSASGPQSETTPFLPNSPYAAAKLYAFHTTRIYRHAYGIFACNGILFNHESPLRGLEFVTRKITNSAARIKLGLQKELMLGNLEAKRDWGYAKEYVEAMWMMLNNGEAEDFVVATGESHSVKDFVIAAFDSLGLNWKNHVKVSQTLKRPMDLNYLCGDIKKIKTKLGWEPNTKFKELVKIMVDADIERWKKYIKGDPIVWDAPLYPPNMDKVRRHDVKKI